MTLNVRANGGQVSERRARTRWLLRDGSHPRSRVVARWTAAAALLLCQALVHRWHFELLSGRHRQLRLPDEQLCVRSGLSHACAGHACRPAHIVLGRLDARCSLSAASSIVCGANAACTGATCVCQTDYYGSGLSCARTCAAATHPPARPSLSHRPQSHTRATAVVCIGNVASGYFFDATEVVPAGANATTTTCAFGLAGYATRLCVWNGPNSQYGVWAAPTSYCQRTPTLCTEAPRM